MLLRSKILIYNMFFYKQDAPTERNQLQIFYKQDAPTERKSNLQYVFYKQDALGANCNQPYFFNNRSSSSANK